MATIKEINDDSKAKLDALLTYANGVTGQEDTNIGDAVKTLCDGYGHGQGQDTLSDYIGNTMERFRTDKEFVLERLVPGGNNNGTLDKIKYWEMPNNKQPLPVWGYAYLPNLTLFDAGYTTAIQNVSLAFSGKNSGGYDLVLRRNDTIVTLHNANSIGILRRLYVPENLINAYISDTVWITVPDLSSKIHPLLIAETVQEKAMFLTDPTTTDGTMVACDADATYTIKGD